MQQNQSFSNIQAYMGRDCTFPYRRMTSVSCMLLLILNFGLLGHTHGGSIAESIQLPADLSKLPQNTFCPGEEASLT